MKGNSKHIFGFRMIEVAPRALSENGWGLWCFRCKKDLGSVYGNPNLSIGSIRNAKKHFGMHRREMRKQL